MFGLSGCETISTII